MAAAIVNGFYNPPVENPNKVFVSMAIKGGCVVTVGDPNAAVKNDEYGIMTITGGSFKSSKRTFNNWNDATITGGTFESTSGAPIISGAYPSDGGHCDLVITGGVFKGTGSDAIVDCSEGQSDPNYVAPKWNVSGGTYNIPVAAKYCASGFEMKQNPDGTYGPIKEKSWSILPRGGTGVGFLGLSGVIVSKESLDYIQGGVEMELNGFQPTVLLNVTAEGGGLTGYLNGSKLQIFKNGSEASGTLNNVQVVLLGH